MRSLRNSVSTSDASLLFFAVRVIPAFVAFFTLYWCLNRRQQLQQQREEIADASPEKEEPPERTITEIESRLVIRTVGRVASNKTCVLTVQEKKNTKANDSSVVAMLWKNLMLTTVTTAKRENTATLSKSKSAHHLLKNKSLEARNSDCPRSRSESNLRDAVIDIESGTTTTAEVLPDYMSGEFTESESFEESTTDDEDNTTQDAAQQQSVSADDSCVVIIDSATTDQDGFPRAPPSNKADSTPDECCGICLLDYEIGVEVAWSPNDNCVHAYHKECIVGWLRKNDDCPLCRQEYLGGGC